jgi:hypothetical protein
MIEGGNRLGTAALVVSGAPPGSRWPSTRTQPSTPAASASATANATASHPAERTTGVQAFVIRRVHGAIKIKSRQLLSRDGYGRTGSRRDFFLRRGFDKFRHDLFPLQFFGENRHG